MTHSSPGGTGVPHERTEGGVSWATLRMISVVVAPVKGRHAVHSS